jgi:hypothetical protein
MIDERIVTVTLDSFIPRSYQIPVLSAMDRGIKRLVLVNHRRAGKDILSINIVCREALKRRGLYLYVLPTREQAKNIIWKGMTKEGKPFLSYIPEVLIKKKNEQDKSIELINGSIIRLAGSNQPDVLRGVNPVAIIFSEFAYQHPQAWPTLSPVLKENKGWAIFQSTPFGENHFFELYQIAKNDPEFFTQFLTIEDTDVVTKEDIQRDLEKGLESPDMVQQEYYCSFSEGARGSYYVTYINELYLKEQIGTIPWDKGKAVHVAADLGVNDQTVLLFFQIEGRKIHIIDLYANSNAGIEHYAHYLQTLPYKIGKLILPHDVTHRDSVTAHTRLQKFKELGFDCVVTERDHLIIDGIENVRSQFNRFWIDEVKCRQLIKALRDYRKEYNEKTKQYNNHPLHDWCSDYTDALRYLVKGLPRLGAGMTEDDVISLRRRSIKEDRENSNSTPGRGGW